MESPKELEGLESIQSCVTRDQARILYSLAKIAPLEGDIVEIGSFHGKSAIALALGNQHNPRPTQIHAVDPFLDGDGDLKHFEQNVERYGVGCCIKQHRASSGEFFRSVKGRLKCRLVFVDAAHDYVSSAFDFSSYRELLCEEGFLVAHDVDNPEYGPGTRYAFFDCLLADERFRLVEHVSNLAAVQRIGLKP